MEEWIRSGAIVNLVLAAIAAEVTVAGVYFWRRGQHLMLLSFLANSLSGASLVLALRAVLMQSGGLFVAMYLLASLLAHVADIALRLLSTRYADGVSSRD